MGCEGLGIWFKAVLACSEITGSQSWLLLSEAVRDPQGEGFVQVASLRLSLSSWFAHH